MKRPWRWAWPFPASLCDGLNTLLAKSGNLISGIDQLAQGAGQLYDGILTLKDGSGALVSGVTRLRDGAVQLSGGLRELNSQGIQKLVDAVDGNLAGITSRLQATLEVSRNYRSFSGLSDDMDGQVRFVYSAAAPETEAEQEN